MRKIIIEIPLRDAMVSISAQNGHNIGEIVI